MFSKSDDIKQLCDALAKAQGEFPAIPKTSEVSVKDRNGQLLYKFKYADLTQIIDSVRPALTKNNISFTQSMIALPEPLGMGFITRLLHSSGEWLDTGFVPATLSQNAVMKDVAGVTTYGKRISLSQALGVSADDDIDAPPENGEVPEVKRKAALAPQSRPAPVNMAQQATLSREQAADLLQQGKSLGWSEDGIMAVVKKLTGKERLSQVPIVALPVINGHLKNNKQEDK